MRLINRGNCFRVSTKQGSAVYDATSFELIAATKDGLTWKVSDDAEYPFEGERVNRYDLERWVEAW